MKPTGEQHRHLGPTGPTLRGCTAQSEEEQRWSRRGRRRAEGLRLPQTTTPRKHSADGCEVRRQPRPLKEERKCGGVAEPEKRCEVGWGAARKGWPGGGGRASPGSAALGVVIRWQPFPRAEAARAGGRRVGAGGPAAAR